MVYGHFTQMHSVDKIYYRLGQEKRRDALEKRTDRRTDRLISIDLPQSGTLIIIMRHAKEIKNIIIPELFCGRLNENLQKDDIILQKAAFTLPHNS